MVRRRQPRFALTILLGLAICGLCLPPLAAAEEFRGRTTQGYYVGIADNRTDHLRSFYIIFSARCDDGTGMRSWDELVIRDLEVSQPGRFVDYEKYSYEGQRGIFRVSARTSGHQENQKRWEGRFKARITQHWRGELLRTCWTGPIEWGVHPSY